MRMVMLIVMTAAMPVVASAQVTLVRLSPVQAIGPKQDDPRACPAEAIGPKQDDPRSPVLAIGPKQDDPHTNGAAVGAYNPETDPHANGGGAEMIGPKQDDPRQGIIVQGGRSLAIGPKQDDPRSPGVAAVGAYDPDSDPQALKAVHGKCGKAKL